jgi:hypothetical protein
MKADPSIAKIKVIVLITLCLLLQVSNVWTYPVISYRQNFSGLDTVTSGQTYVELDTTDNAVFIEKEDASEQTKPKLFRCKSPYYLRLEDSDGKTLWKTSQLVWSPQDTLYFANPDYEDVWVGNPENCDGDYVRVAVDKNEQLIDAYEDRNILVTKLLFDASDTKQMVGKKLDGYEFQLPDYLIDYELHGKTDNDSAWIFVRRYYFDEWSEEEIEDDKPLGLVIVDINGNVRLHADTNISSKDIKDIIISPRLNRAIIPYYGDLEREVSIVILGNEAPIQKTYRNLRLLYGKKTLFPNVRDYFVMYGIDCEYYIISFKTGDVVAQINGAALDLTQTDDRLLGVIGYGPFAAVVDIISGKLIQGLADYDLSLALRYEISDVKLSPNADEVWIYEKYSHVSGKTRHFRSVSK